MLRLLGRAALVAVVAAALAPNAGAAPAQPKRVPTRAASVPPGRPKPRPPKSGPPKKPRPPKKLGPPGGARIPPGVARAAEAICRPRFRVDGSPLEAGTAFTLRASTQHAPARVMLVTAQHLFGAAGGLDAEVPWAEMPASVRAVQCARLQDRRQVVKSPHAVALPGAKPFDAGGPDVAAFFVAGKGGRALELAVAPVRPGDRVWLVAQVLGGAPRGRLLHPATATALEGDWLTYRFDDAGLLLQATSGAPVVDREGRVVGLNLGGGLQKGKLAGVAQSAASVANALARCRSEECRAPGPPPRLEPPGRRR